MIPREYLSLSLADVLALSRRPVPVGAGVSVKDITAALSSLARRVAREDAERERRARAWLAERFEALGEPTSRSAETRKTRFAAESRCTDASGFLGPRSRRDRGATHKVSRC